MSVAPGVGIFERVAALHEAVTELHALLRTISARVDALDLALNGSPDADLSAAAQPVVGMRSPLGPTVAAPPPPMLDAARRDRALAIGRAAGGIVAGRSRFVMLAHEVARATGVDPKDILSSSRRQPAAHARQALFLLAHEAGMGASAIGRYAGRDHSTVLSGIKAARARRDAQVAGGAQ